MFLFVVFKKQIKQVQNLDLIGLKEMKISSYLDLKTVVFLLFMLMPVKSLTLNVLQTSMKKTADSPK